MPGTTTATSPTESFERPHKSQVSWSEAERNIIDQLVARRVRDLGLPKVARLLRTLVLEEADRAGIDTTVARQPLQRIPRTPRQSRRAAA